jgi:hypothetical protein
LVANHQGTTQSHCSTHQGTSSLRVSLENADWLSATWADAIAKAIEETGLDVFPEDLPWTVEKVLFQEFFPDE